MPNIFLTIDKINALLNSNSLSAADQNVLHELLEGNSHHVGLKSLAQCANSMQCKMIEEQMCIYYQSIPSLQWWYRRQLRSIYQDLIVLREHSENAIEALGLAKNSKAFSSYAALQDDIYQQTAKKFLGTLMLPIQQCLDYRLGNSKGECSGYVVDWIEDLLRNKNPFGIPIHSAPPFQPISLQSPLGHLYPDLNHCAPLTKHIAELQQLNFRFATQGMDHKANGRIYQYHQGGVVLTKDSAQLAKYLLKISTLNPGFGYYLSLRNYNNGHALGFYKDKQGAFHFLDVNTGWYRFQNAAHFVAWLGFYFPAMNYEIKYDACELFAFGFQRKKEGSNALSWNAICFFAKREAYLINKRVAQSFNFFRQQAPVETQEQPIKQDSLKINFAQDDLFLKPASLLKRELSLPIIKNPECKKSKEGFLVRHYSTPDNSSPRI